MAEKNTSDDALPGVKGPAPSPPAARDEQRDGTPISQQLAIDLNSAATSDLALRSPVREALDAQEAHLLKLLSGHLQQLSDDELCDMVQLPRDSDEGKVFANHVRLLMMRAASGNLTSPDTELEDFGKVCASRDRLTLPRSQGYPTPIALTPFTGL